MQIVFLRRITRREDGCTWDFRIERQIYNWQVHDRTRSIIGWLRMVVCQLLRHALPNGPGLFVS